EAEFTRDERENVTILCGGFSLRHDRFVKASCQGLGYNVELIPTPVKADFQAGKEFGNNGQCNPTYFTVGSLVNYLIRLREEGGLSSEDVIKRYSFITTGACGPCRFGMYEAEYRLALRNSGFDGFRVLLFQYQGGLNQSAKKAGLEVNLDFALALLNAVLIGDVLNELAYQIRPYETVSGKTDEVFEKVTQRVCDHMRARDWSQVRKGWASRSIAKFASAMLSEKEVAGVIEQLTGDYYLSVLRECREMIEREIEVDFTRAKPIAKITGEFWAQTTEGDGNFHMFRFIESQGAEVLVEPIMTWIAYLLTQAQTKFADTKGLGAGDDIFSKVKAEFDFRKKDLLLGAVKRVLVREYDRIRNALGGTVHEQVCQMELQRMAHPFYNRKGAGGEGHLEVAKNIYYAHKGLAHMVLSLKPFGCMPSTQSDGAQAAVVSHYPDMVYLPVETSGEGDVNAHSRVQMALGEAKSKCREEFKTCLARAGYSLEEIREFVGAHPKLRNPIQHVPHREGVTGKAASFVLHVAELMTREGYVANIPADQAAFA
ncbi:MAG: activator of (R)-2-hydroxyglutaryl-CoA dehydratase, partial [Candidatus Hydrogenedentota bacterium]